MNEVNKKENKKNIVYLLIGVLTLIIAISGATFAYFTATDDEANVITGNMATVSLNLQVNKILEETNTAMTQNNGLIPMSNGMIESAINNTSNAVCIDDNDNAVCQIYEIVIKNDSSAAQLVDGYVSLRYGSGAPIDYTSEIGTYVNGAKFDNKTKTASGTGTGTTMRWAQVFKGTGSTVTNNATTSDYSTKGEQVLGTSSEKVAFSNFVGYAANAASQDPLCKKDIRDDFELITTTEKEVDSKTVAIQGVLSPLTIAGTSYNVIGTNYIRVSNHDWTADSNGKQTYTRQNDMSSALVLNHSISPLSTVRYYIVVWLSETGTNQTADENNNPTELNFFEGNVTFVSAQGSEVSATFADYTRVSSQ